MLRLGAPFKWNEWTSQLQLWVSHKFSMGNKLKWARLKAKRQICRSHSKINLWINAYYTFHKLFLYNMAKHLVVYNITFKNLKRVTIFCFRAICQQPDVTCMGLVVTWDNIFMTNSHIALFFHKKLLPNINCEPSSKHKEIYFQKWVFILWKEISIELKYCKIKIKQ